MFADTNSAHDEQWPFLNPEHAKLLRGSGISPKVARERGYRTENTKSQLLGLGFGKHQARVPALVIPLYNVHGESSVPQLRPDQPRMVDGRIAKYERPRRMGMVIDAHPRLTCKRANLQQNSPDEPAELVPLVADPTIPLFITEAVRKADAAISLDLVAVALLGVWCWRGTNDAGGSTVLADFESIALKNRDIYIAFDSDVMQNRMVHAALARLKGFLESRGALVHLIYLPAGAHGAKLGLDDWIFSQRELGLTDEQIRNALFALATDILRLPAFEGRVRRSKS